VAKGAAKCERCGTNGPPKKRTKLVRRGHLMVFRPRLSATDSEKPPEKSRKTRRRRRILSRGRRLHNRRNPLPYKGERNKAGRRSRIFC
jgi:hypothetical protein